MTEEEYYKMADKVRDYEYMKSDLKIYDQWLKEFDKNPGEIPAFKISIECTNFFCLDKMFIRSHWKAFSSYIKAWIIEDRERIIKELEEL